MKPQGHTVAIEQSKDQDMPKKKHKPKKISLAGGQSVPQRQTHAGRPAGRIEPPADLPMLQARMKQAGDADTPEARRKARSTLNESDLGRCILAIYPDDGRDNRDMQAKLEATWQAVCSARETYSSRILGKSRHAQGAALPMLPDPMQTDQSHSVDLRSADEKDEAAKRRDAYWADLIAKLPAPQMRLALQPAMDAISGALWRDAAPTQRGRNAVAALVWLAEADNTP